MHRRERRTGQRSQPQRNGRLAFDFAITAQHGLAHATGQHAAAGLPLDLAIYAGAAFNLGAVPGIALSGYLSQKLGLRRVITGFLLLAAVVMVLFGFAERSSTILTLFGLIGFFSEGGFVGLYAIAARLYPTELRTTGVGWAIGAGRTGAIAGPFVGGLLVAYGLSIGANFRWFAITLVFAGIFTMLIKSDRVS